MASKNWYPTLNEALQSQDLVNLWPLGSNIQYGQTVWHIVETGMRIKWGKETPVYTKVSVYRDLRGMYEAPISYRTN